MSMGGLVAVPSNYSIGCVVAAYHVTTVRFLVEEVISTVDLPERGAMSVHAVRRRHLMEIAQFLRDIASWWGYN